MSAILLFCYTVLLFLFLIYYLFYFINYEMVEYIYCLVEKSCRIFIKDTSWSD